MNEKIQIVEESVREESNAFLENVRKIVLAGAGVVATAQESAENQIGSFIKDVESFVNKLVERGEIADKEGRKLLTEVVEKRKHVAEEMTSKLSTHIDSAENNVSGRFDKVVNSFNVPTKSDLNTLTQKVSILAEKVDQLKNAQKEALSKQADAVAEAASYKKDATTAKRKATIIEKEALAAKEEVVSLKAELAATKKEVDALNAELAAAKKETTPTKAQKSVKKAATNGASKATKQTKELVEKATNA